MNKQRRKTLRELYDIIAEAKDNLEMVMEEEEEYRDNIPENLQGSERYEKAEEAVYNLEEAISNIEEALSLIEETIYK